MTYQYDSTNIFAKILRGEVDCNKIYENNYALAFHDINPQAPTHVLVIPKGEFVHYEHFLEIASPDFVFGFGQAVLQVLISVKHHAGFRMIVNQGLYGGQEVQHFHVHILSGCKLGSMLNADFINQQKGVTS